MGPWPFMALSHREPDHPRQILIRASLHQARAQDADPKTLQLSANPNDSAEAYAPVKVMAMPAPRNVAWGYDWGHSNAS